MTRPFTIDLGWAGLLDRLGVRAGDVLRTARLPDDLFARPRPTVSPDDFNRLFAALCDRIDSDTPGLVLGQAVLPEIFSPPLFAAFCSPDFAVASRRLSTYKPLVGPLVLDVRDASAGLELTFGAEPGVDLPAGYVVTEFVFLVHLARLATRTDIHPIRIEMAEPPEHPDHDVFFGCRVRAGSENRIVFSASDARRPFLSANPALFAAFAPELQARLDSLGQDASVTARLRIALMEALPAGQADVGSVGRKLGMSARTLQRRLADEGTGFQAELQALREKLARTYLSGTGHSSAEIAFLLGYEDPNSFIRAFHGWTGTTPEALRAAQPG